MNSFVITILICFYHTSALSILSNPIDVHKKIKEAANLVIAACRVKTEASEEDYQTLVDHRIPESPKGLCMLGCVFEKSGLMKNGQFNAKGLEKALTRFIGDDDVKRRQIQDLGSVCEREISAERGNKCENAKLLVDCIVKNGSNYGLKIDNE